MFGIVYQLETISSFEKPHKYAEFQGRTVVSLRQIAVCRRDEMNCFRERDNSIQFNTIYMR